MAERGAFEQEPWFCRTDFFSFQTVTPGYTDTQPFPAAPTKWTYRAIYRVGDSQVGLWSLPVSVTVGT
jgi:hypothetical protein